LTAVLAGFGLELAGRASARLALLLGIAVHPSTVLRLVKALPGPEVAGAPEVLGIDDFALRKGVFDPLADGVVPAVAVGWDAYPGPQDEEWEDERHTVRGAGRAARRDVRA
jgi:hypothetical protein